MSTTTITNTANCSYKLQGATLNATPAKADLLVIGNILSFTKEFIPTVGKSGDTVTISIEVSLLASFPNSITNVIVTDMIPSGITLVTGSIEINGVSNPTANPNTGITVGTINPGETKTITFQVTIN